MYYDRIVISGCIRFSVSGRYHIDLRPTAKVQMILGTNGSGKTTLAQLGFSPLPISPKWMEKDGYFIKEGTYKGDSYRLEGKYGSKPSYSFTKNHEVLLQDGNVTTYLDLVRIHLNYNPWLHDLIIGKTKFTDLGPGQRQDFLSKISNSDFTHAFKMLAIYKKQHGHYQSVVKFLQGRVNEESVKLLDEDARKQHEALRGELQEELKVIQEIPNLDTVEVDLAKTYRTLNDHIYLYNDSIPISPLLSSPSELTEFHEVNNTQFKELQGQLNLVSSDLDQLTQKLGFITNSNEDKCELILELDKLTQEVVKYESLPGNIPVEYYVKNSGPVIEALRYSLSHMSSEEIDLDKEHTLRTSVMETSSFLSKCEARLEQVQSEITHITGIEEVKCPSCDTLFKPGIDPKLLSELNERRVKGFEYIEESTVAKSKAVEVLDEYLAKKKAYDELEFIKGKYLESHKGLFTYIDSIGGMLKGKDLLSNLHTYSQFCEAYHRKVHLMANIDRLKTVTVKVDELEKEKLSLTKMLEEKQSLFTQLTVKRDQYKSNVLAAEKTLEEMESDDANIKHLLKLTEDFSKALENEFEVVKQEVKKEFLNDLLGRLATIHNTLNEQDTIRSLLKDFNQQLDVAKRKVAISKEIVDSLSPKDGLIAEQLSLSIGSWITGLNQLVDKVWGYPLEVRMGTVGDTGLDYKFPMSDSEVERDDVSEGSDSMLEMINRAVAMTCYYSLDLTDVPLFLDEPGRTFDKTHKFNLIPLIRDLTDSVRFSQIVLISHSEDIQTAFPNSETLILDTRNVSYPHPYNEHVSFTKE